MSKILISFLGNLNYDTRTFNFFDSLNAENHDVYFVGFDWLTEGFQTFQSEQIKIYKLVKARYSILFYLKFFIIQLKSAFKINADIYLASDFFSLPALFIVAKLKRKKIFYDSREIFTELPFHENKKILKKIIKMVEAPLIRNVNKVFVTGEMDAEYLGKKYNINNFSLQRNFPLLNTNVCPVDLNNRFNIPGTSKAILYQGTVVKGRGLEIYFECIQKLEEFYLVILGSGEHLEHYKSLSDKLEISSRIIFAGKINQDEILNYTAGAFAGLSVIDNISINNYYALPNKLFEYIMTGLPVIVNDLPQMKNIVEKYNVGAVLKTNHGAELAEVLLKWKNDEHLYMELKNNCIKASGELNWEKEFEKNKLLFH
jgi:glycosyltransferase involved in cell wall biosynthesis